VPQGSGADAVGAEVLPRRGAVAAGDSRASGAPNTGEITDGHRQRLTSHWRHGCNRTKHYGSAGGTELFLL